MDRASPDRTSRRPAAPATPEAASGARPFSVRRAEPAAMRASICASVPFSVASAVMVAAGMARPGPLLARSPFAARCTLPAGRADRAGDPRISGDRPVGRIGRRNRRRDIGRQVAQRRGQIERRPRPTGHVEHRLAHAQAQPVDRHAVAEADPNRREQVHRHASQSPCSDATLTRARSGIDRRSRAYPPRRALQIRQGGRQLHRQSHQPDPSP